MVAACLRTSHTEMLGAVRAGVSGVGHTHTCPHSSAQHGRRRITLQQDAQAPTLLANSLPCAVAPPACLLYPLYFLSFPDPAAGCMGTTWPSSLATATTPRTLCATC